MTIHNTVYTWGVHPYNLRLNAHAVRKARQTGTAINDPVEKYLNPEKVDTSFVHGRIVKVCLQLKNVISVVHVFSQ